jgi:outer membrane protein OmpA-like peptidoglycan-associated protein
MAERVWGGFDIYKAYDVNGQWDNITHLGYPLNTSYDEIYYTLSDDSRTALFSSNREQSFFIDEEMEACCFDVYEMDILPFVHLITQTFDAVTGDSLRGTVIQLIDRADPENLVVEHYDPDEAEYRFPLDRDREYMVITNKESYLADTLYFDTRDMDEDEREILKQIYLQPDELDLEVLVFDARTRKPLLGVEVAVVNTDDLDAERLEKVNADTNVFNFDIQRGPTYRILANRKGYATGTELLLPEEYEELERVVKRIYLDVGDLGDFLPLVLYFDNDEPDRRTWSRNTDVKYSETFPSYFEKKDKFIETFTEPLDGEEKEEEALRLNRFFETEVKKGKEDLSSFLEVLVPHLEAGDRVDIYLKGYASPRATRQYNLLLGFRRVNSVRNELMNYENGILRQYLNEGLLNIREESFGSTNAPPDVVGDLDDERNSIYSLGASKERRVEIIKIDVGQ